MDWRSPWVHKESDMGQRLSLELELELELEGLVLL